VLVTFALAGLAALAPLTTPPDSVEPIDQVMLDADRQEIVDDLVSLGIMQDRPLDPGCLAPIVAEFPDDEVDSLTARLLHGIDVEISEGALAPLDDPLSDAEAQLTVDVLVCTSGDADRELVDEVASHLADDDDFVDWNIDCIRATLTVFPDEMLDAAGDGDDPDELLELLGDSFDEARGGGMSDEDLDELFGHVTGLLLCSPDGRELLLVFQRDESGPPATDG
jgi:hypothetical protein